MKMNKILFHQHITIGFALYSYIYYMPDIHIKHAFSTDGSASSSDINSIGL